MADPTLSPLESNLGSDDSSELEEISNTTKRVQDTIKRVYGRLLSGVHPDPAAEDFARIMVARGGLPSAMIKKMNIWHKAHPNEVISYGPIWPAGVDRPDVRSDVGRQPVNHSSIANHGLIVNRCASEPISAFASYPARSADNSSSQSHFELVKPLSRERSPHVSNIRIPTPTVSQLPAKREFNGKPKTSYPFSEAITKDQRTEIQALIAQLDVEASDIKNDDFEEHRWLFKLRSLKRKLEVEKLENVQYPVTGKRRSARLQEREQMMWDQVKRYAKRPRQVWNDDIGDYDDLGPSTLTAKSKPHSKTGNRARNGNKTSNMESIPSEVTGSTDGEAVLTGQTQANTEETLVQNETMSLAKANEDSTAVDNMKIKFNLKIKESAPRTDGASEKDFFQQEIAILRSDNRLLNQQLEHSKEREKTVLVAAEKVIERSACDKIEAIEQGIDNATNFSLSLEDHTTGGGDQVLAFLQQSLQKKLKKLEECRYNIQGAPSQAWIPKGDQATTGIDPPSS